MSSDLRVRILPTTQVFARCPTLIQVEVTNAGADPIQSHAADEGFAVCLASPDILVEGTSVIKKRLSRGELSLLASGQSVRIDFVDVSFTVPGSIQVSAEADCDGGATGEIVNNDRTDPLRIDLATLSIGTAARLRTAKLKLSLEGSTGARTEISSAPPSSVCPGATLIVETTVSNLGSRPLPANAVATLTFFDSAGVGTALPDQGLPPIPVGLKVPLTFIASVPTPASPDELTVRVCADISNLGIPLCATSVLCEQEGPFPIDISISQPATFLSVDDPILPGEPISINWSITSGCADLGDVTAEISFNGEVLYVSKSHGVGPQGEAGEQHKLVLPNLSQLALNSFYKSGTHTLDLDVSGTGQDPGPYHATTQFTILGELPDATWWTFTSPGKTPASAAWKATYTVGGALTNKGKHGLTPSAIVLTETEVGTSPPAVVVQTATAGPINSGGVGAASWLVTQDWEWFEIGVWVPYLPLRYTKTFSYTVSASLGDDYGNSYPTIVSSPQVVVVTVAVGKQLLLSVAFDLQATALALAIAAVLAAASVILIPFAAALGISAATALSLAIGFGAKANDPLAPDFDYQQRIHISTGPLSDSVRNFPPQLASLRSVIELLARNGAALEALARTEARLAAARIDDDLDGMRLQADAYRDSLHLLLLSALALPGALIEARPIFDEQNFSVSARQETLATWTQEGTPGNLSVLWAQGRLPEETLAQLDAAVRSGLGDSERTMAELLDAVSQSVLRASREIEAQSAIVLAGIENRGRTEP